MSLKDLNKEQKQYLILGVIVAIVLAVLIVFGIKISLSSISKAREEVQALTEKIESAEKSVTRNQKDSAEFRSTIDELTGYIATIPPDRNYYSWATETVYSIARLVRFDIDAIDEVSIAAAKKDTANQGTVKLESYSLRIAAHGGYENIKRFLHQIAMDHPLVRVTGVEISTGSQADVHDVQLFIEWPFNMGYIAETWKGIALPSVTTDTASVLSVSSPDAENTDQEAEPSTLNKTPTPPTSRPQSDVPVP